MRKNILLLGAGLLTSVVLGLGIACGDDNKDNNGGDNTPAATQATETSQPTEADQTPADATDTPEDATPTG